MASVYPSGLISDVAAITIEDPILKLRYPDKDKAISGGFVFIGLPGQDPEIESQQKKVYIVSDEGYSVAIDQPVKLNAGGMPEYDGNPVLLSVDGSYSMKVFDHLYDPGKTNNPVFYFPHVEHRTLLGYSGVIPEEAVTILNGETELTFSKIECTSASFYMSGFTSGTQFRGNYMRKDVDYEVISASKIKLKYSIANGNVILARALDPTGKTVNVGDSTEPFYIYPTKTAAKASGLDVGASVLVNGGDASGDGNGGSYLVVAGGTGIDDNYTFIDMDNGNQLKLKSVYQVFNSYYETVKTASVVTNSITIDATDSSIFKVDLTDNVSSINVTNLPASGEVKLQIEFKQNATAAKTITWLINGVAPKISGGILPTMTAALSSIDEYIIRTSDKGVTWKLNIVGQDIK